MSRWIPRIIDVPDITHSSGALIFKAGNKCKERLKERILQGFRDDVGLFGFATDSFVLCAKSYVYGWIVSCHKYLLEQAIRREVALVMYIDRNDKFYKFNPKGCLERGTENKRGGIPMINFDVRDGINCETNQKVETTA